MGNVTILDSTTKNPITLIGERAGICYGADITNARKNYQRGLNCIMSNHGRTLEYVNVECVLSGYSARVIREWYTHIGCLPTRLQESTRYIDYSNFEYVIPHSILENTDALGIYNDCMDTISDCCKMLNNINIPREDIGMMLPLSMATKIVDKRNLRNLLDMSHQRKCNRAYWEYRELFRDLELELSKYSEEWEWIVNNLFIPKCKYIGECNEYMSCKKDK